MSSFYGKGGSGGGGTSASARLGRNREIESRVNLPWWFVLVVVVLLARAGCGPLPIFSIGELT
jgi:hypothetical protein